MTLVPSLGNNLHEWVFQVSKFELFEKHTATNYFQIEREKSYDFLIITEQVPVRKRRTRTHATETKDFGWFLPNPTV